MLVSVQLSTFDTLFSSNKKDSIIFFVIAIPVPPCGVNKSLKLTDFLEKVTRQSTKKTWPFLGLPYLRDHDPHDPLEDLMKWRTAVTTM